MIGKETDDAIKKLFGSLLSKHEIGLEKSMKVNNFVFDKFDILY